MSASADILDFSRKRPEWQQDALRRLAVQGSITPQELQDYVTAVKVERKILPADRKPALSPLAETHLANTDQEQARITLKAVSDLQNVNQLKSGETLEFGPKGVTLVYGDNGSGKSGYTRIFKKASAARSAEDILGDIFSPDFDKKPPAAATFIIAVRKGETETEERVAWKSGDGSPETLRQLRIFDRWAAKLYVEKETDLTFVPFNLDLLDRLADLCGKVKAVFQEDLSRLDAEYRTLQNAIPFKEAEARTFAAGLSARTTIAQIDTACKWSPQDETRLKEIRALLDAAEKTLKDLRLKKGRFDSLQTQVEGIEKALTDTVVADLRQRRSNATDLRAAAEATGKESFSKDPKLLPGVGGAAWRALWEAARAYSTQMAYPGQEFPVKTLKDGKAGQCVLCHQELGPDGQRRLADFEKFVRGEVEKKAIAAERLLATTKATLTGLDTSLTTATINIIAEIESDDPALAKDLRTFFGEATSRKDSLLGAIESGDFKKLVAPPAPVSGRVKAYIGGLDGKIAETKRAVSPEEKIKLQAEGRRLETRKALLDHRPTLDAIVTNRVGREKLEGCISDLATNAISLAKSNLTEKYVNQQFRDILQEELRALGVRRKVTLQVVTQKGASYVRPVFVDSGFRDLDRILSEGEHRAVALACFLAEARMLGTENPLLIDDAVSSLDHVRCEQVARRLVREAKTRQVIVFTHDMVFWGEVCFVAGEEGVPVITKDLRRDGDLCGKVGDGAVPWPILPVKDRLHCIESGELPKLRPLYDANAPEYRAAARYVGELLRETWERVIEETIFNETVVRYRRSIESNRLRKVTVEHDDWEKVFRGISRTSRWAHDESRGTGGTPPTPDVLQTEITTIREFVAQINKRNDSVDKERKKRTATPAP